MSLIEVRVVYVSPEKSQLESHQVTLGATIQDLTGKSNLLRKAQNEGQQIGIFGKKIKWETTLRHGDRVEIYRPLKADPKIIRRRKAAVSGKRRQK